MKRRLLAAVCSLAVAGGAAWLVSAQDVAAQGQGQGPPPGIETRHVCGPVSGPHARCQAVQVLNPSALRAQPQAKGGQKGPPTTTTTTPTTTTTSPTTTTTSTTTTVPTTTTSPPTTTTTSTTTTTTTLPSSACTTAHPGFTPCDIQSAYKLPGTSAGSGQTVAIVDAYDDPNAEADLAVYRSAYGLSPCTTANGCFRKVDQNGGKSYPAGDTGWSEEISLDLDMVSAACPNCKILLVEANSNGLGDLLTAEQTAGAQQGVSAVSNSWGASENLFIELLYDNYFRLGVAVTASSGDSGYGTLWPAAISDVVAVGGTSLTRASNARGWSESAWSGAGSGCTNEPKPSYQNDTGCSNRTMADVSAVADPHTAVAVYDTYNEPGWMAFGGTSVASPIIASIYALAGNSKTSSAAAIPYAHTSSLFDVTTGPTPSVNCSPAYLCNAAVGYDGPTGLGTPNGTGAF